MMISDNDYFILCPYCMGSVEDTVGPCPHCRWNMSNDAGYEMDGAEYKEEFNLTCPFCQAPAHKWAFVCAQCGQGEMLNRKVEIDWLNQQPHLAAAPYWDIAKQLGVSLPIDFRFYFKAHHGATPVQCLFEYVGGFSRTKTSRIAALLTIEAVYADALNVLQQQADAIVLVPFAKVDEGGYLCLDYRDNEQKPPIVFWQPNIFRGRVWPVAASISELMARLKAPN